CSSTCCRRRPAASPPLDRARAGRLPALAAEPMAAASLRLAPRPVSTWDGVERRRRPRHRRELYIDAFRGVMALVMVQGHLFDALLRPALLADPVYQFQLMFH